jgi:cell division protein FtsB
MMNAKQGILISAAVFLIVSLFFFIIFSERGLADLNLLKKERDQIKTQNRQLTEENLGLSVEIDRLKNDPEYIESVARRQFGMIGQDEVVVKPRRSADR